MLFLDESTVIVTLWVDIATRLGVPVALLILLAWYHIQTTKGHAQLVKAKDDEIKRLNDEHDDDIAKVNEQVTRVNELRVSEHRQIHQDIIGLLNQTNKTMSETDKTLTMILERLK